MRSLPALHTLFILAFVACSVAHDGDVIHLSPTPGRPSGWQGQPQGLPLPATPPGLQRSEPVQPWASSYHIPPGYPVPQRPAGLTSSTPSGGEIPIEVDGTPYSFLSTASETKNLDGPNFKVQYRRETTDYGCEETLHIEGVPSAATHLFRDQFSPVCSHYQRLFYVQGDELLIGGIDQNFLLYGHAKLPNQLIVIDGVADEIANEKFCTVYTYLPNGKESVLYDIKMDRVDEEKCGKIRALMKSVETSLMKQEKEILPEIEEELNKSIKSVVKGKYGLSDQEESSPGSDSSSSSSSSEESDSRWFGWIRTSFVGKKLDQ